MNSFDQDLFCYHCNKIFESVPITLFPCGWVICSHHFGEPMKTFHCNLCQTIHQVNFDQCIKTKTLEYKYLKYTIERSLKEFENEIIEIEMIKKDPNSYLDDFFSGIINKIDLRRELTKKQIDSHFEYLHDKIISTKKSYENSLGQNKEFKDFDCEKIHQDNKSFTNEFASLKDVQKNFTSLSDLRIKIREKRTEIKNLIDSLTDFKTYDLKSGILSEFFYNQIARIEEKVKIIDCLKILILIFLAN